MLDSSQPVGSALACPLSFPKPQEAMFPREKELWGLQGPAPEQSLPGPHSTPSRAAQPASPAAHGPTLMQRGLMAPELSWPAAVWTLCPVTSRGNDVAPQGVPTRRGCDGKGRQGLHAFTAPQTGSTSRTFHHDSNPPPHRGPSCHWPLRLPRPRPSPASPLLTTKTTTRCSGAESLRPVKSLLTSFCRSPRLSAVTSLEHERRAQAVFPARLFLPASRLGSTGARL